MATFYITFFRANKIFIIAALISLALSLHAYHNSDPLNYDGILYLNVAEVYLKSGFNAALALYPWPFYAILIAWLSQFTHLSLQHSAQVLNAIFLIAIVISFIQLVEKIADKKSYLSITAAIVILAFPTLSHYRDLIVRDFGYWAFTLISLNQLIQYVKTSHWIYALTFTISLLCAALFRIEGAILLIFSPFALFFLKENSGVHKIKNFLKLYAFPLFLSLIYLIWHHLTTPSHGLMIGRMHEITDLFINGWQTIINNFQEKLAAIHNHVIDKTVAGGDSASWFFFGFSGLFIKNIVNALTVLYTLLALYAIYKKLLPDNPAVRLIIYFVLLNLSIGLIFYAQHLFLSDRYLIAAALLLLTFVTFGLQQLYDLWKTRQQRWIFPLISLLFLVTTFGGIFSFGYSKAYIKEAGLWIKEHTPNSAIVYSNNKQVLFYAERTPINFQKNYDDSNPLLTLQQESWQNADYLAIRINKNVEEQTPAVIRIIGRQPIKVFINKRGDKVLVFLLSQKR